MCHILEGSECCAWFKLYKGNKQIDLIVKLVVVRYGYVLYTSLLMFLLGHFSNILLMKS